MTVSIVLNFETEGEAIAFLQGYKPSAASTPAATAKSKPAVHVKNEIGDPEGTTYYSTDDEKLIKLLPGDPAMSAEMKSKVMKMSPGEWKKAFDAQGAKLAANTPSTAAAGAASSNDPFGATPADPFAGGARTATKEEALAALKALHGKPDGSGKVMEIIKGFPGALAFLDSKKTPEEFGAVVTAAGA